MTNFKTGSEQTSKEEPKKKISIRRYMATKRAQMKGQLRQNLQSLQDLQKKVKK